MAKKSKPLIIRISASSDPGSKTAFDLGINISGEEIARWPLDRRRALCDGIALILEARDDSGQFRRLKSEISERLSILLVEIPPGEGKDVSKTHVHRRRGDAVQPNAGNNQS